VSEYSFGSFDPDDMSGAGEQQPMEQGPKWFRDYMDKVSGQLKDLKAENDRLQAEKKQQAVADALKAKGYAPQAAGLFTGMPDKLDEWLTANGGALAKLPGDGQGQQGEEATQQGPPASTVPADGQEQMQRMQEQGTQGVAPPKGSEAELAAAIAACKTDEEFAQLMQSHGSPYDWSPS
jgi:hypothetical protein